jgi:citronellol/citronellal dehydrogenase
MVLEVKIFYLKPRPPTGSPSVSAVNFYYELQTDDDKYNSLLLFYFENREEEMKKRTVVITGGGQGIGQAIAFRFAEEGANVVVVSKDGPKQLQETRDGIVERGGEALLCEVDVRDCEAINNMVAQTMSHFGGIDVLVNNTSAPIFNHALSTSAEQFDLIVSTSVRASFFLSVAAFPHLKKAKNPHIINIAPPLGLEVQWLKDYLAFSIGKYGMSLCTRGLAAEFEPSGVAVNSLWPQTPIATPRLKDHLASEVYAGSRWPSIVADATYVLAAKTAREATGQFFIDEALLRAAGVTDFSHYAIDPSHPLVQDIFLPFHKGMIPLSRELFTSR